MVVIGRDFGIFGGFGEEDAEPVCTGCHHSDSGRIQSAQQRYILSDLMLGKTLFVAKTMVEFIEELNLITDKLKKECNGSISVVSGCELFMRFVTRVASDSTEVFFESIMDC